MTLWESTAFSSLSKERKTYISTPLHSSQLWIQIPFWMIENGKSFHLWSFVGPFIHIMVICIIISPTVCWTVGYIELGKVVRDTHRFIYHSNISNSQPRGPSANSSKPQVHPCLSLHDDDNGKQQQKRSAQHLSFRRLGIEGFPIAVILFQTFAQTT